MTNEARLRTLVRDSELLMQALRAARETLDCEWAIGAGTLRDLVWDHLHERPFSIPRDIDVAFFDPDDLSEEREGAIEASLSALVEVPWEARNQAAVHTWFHKRFGNGIEPLTSVEDAISSWPETATCVGVSLGADDHVRMIAPHGLDDVFGMVLRRNVRAVTVEEFWRRAHAKRIVERWPNVTVVDPETGDTRQGELTLSPTPS